MGELSRVAVSSLSCLFLQSITDTRNVRKTQTEKETSDQTKSDTFNSFQFWRDPLPSIDTDLLDLLVRSDKPLTDSIFALD